MLNKQYPILLNGCDINEISSPMAYAKHKPWLFKNLDYIKKQKIKRCYIVFYYNPEKNKFFKKLRVIFNFHSGSTITKVFIYKNALIAISPLGSAAAAKLMEELSVFGITEFIAVGSAGCLNPNIKNKFLLVNKAIRDEGVSYHYLKPSTYVSTNKELNTIIQEFLKDRNINYVKGVTWTSDGFYRETNKKVEMAKELGANAVEMECAAWCAVAKYRGLNFLKYYILVILLIRNHG